MATNLPPPEPEEEQGSPEWMVTFSDCMTLLLTFFVLLLTFSSISDKDFNRASMEFQAGMNSILGLSQNDKDALLARIMIIFRKQPDRGSEIPSPEVGPDNDTVGAQEFMQDSVQQQKIFLLDSGRLFVAQSERLRAGERGMLLTMGEYLNRVPGRIVISENGPAGDVGTGLGFPRAMAIKNFLVRECGVDASRISVSISGTAGARSYERQRRLEITLLEQGVHK